MMYIAEIFSRVFLKLKILFHKLLNIPLYKKGVVLYGIPRMVKRNNIKFSKGIRINSDVFLHAADKIIIGENCTLSDGVKILTTGYEISNWSNNVYKKDHITKNVIIEKNVWLCANCIVLPGARIAEGCVIAAGSIVTDNLLEPYTLYGGVPAKKIKKLK